MIFYQRNNPLVEAIGGDWSCCKIVAQVLRLQKRFRFNWNDALGVILADEEQRARVVLLQLRGGRHGYQIVLEGQWLLKASFGEHGVRQVGGLSTW